MAVKKIFVGTDSSQKLAVKVLEYTIKKYASEDVEVIPMCDLPLPVPKSKLNQQKTGFSFSRFCIPQFMEYQGKALYLDADMIVLSDIMELFNWPMENHHILIQKNLKLNESKRNKKVTNAKKRTRQCSVMVIDCEKCHWDINAIVNDLDSGKYNYSQLMHEMCLVEDSNIGEVLPFTWNSLEYYDDKTQLLHYTDMNTQPWVSSFNKNADVWYGAVLEMLHNGIVTEKEIIAEINAGYFRPSLLVDIHRHQNVPSAVRVFWNLWMKGIDLSKGYARHREVVARVAQIKKEMAVKN